MPAPIFVDIPKDQWVKVATGVVVGQIHKMGTGVPMIMHTYVPTTTAVPVIGPSDAPNFLQPTLQIASTYKIDVYLYAIGKPAKVRVDL